MGFEVLSGIVAHEMKKQASLKGENVTIDFSQVERTLSAVVKVLADNYPQNGKFLMDEVWRELKERKSSP